MKSWTVCSLLLAVALVACAAAHAGHELEEDAIHTQKIQFAVTRLKEDQHGAHTINVIFDLDINDDMTVEVDDQTAAYGLNEFMVVGFVDRSAATPIEVIIQVYVQLEVTHDNGATLHQFTIQARITEIEGAEFAQLDVVQQVIYIHPDGKVTQTDLIEVPAEDTELHAAAGNQDGTSAHRHCHHNKKHHSTFHRMKRMFLRWFNALPYVFQCLLSFVTGALLGLVCCVIIKTLAQFCGGCCKRSSRPSTGSYDIHLKSCATVYAAVPSDEIDDAKKAKESAPLM